MIQLGLREERIVALRKLFSEMKISKSPGAVLSLGCGVAPELGILQPAAYLGVDTDARYIEWCEQHLEDASRDFRTCSALDALDACTRTFDVVLALDVNSTFFFDALLELGARVLKPDGMFIITERTKNKQIYGRSLLEPYLGSPFVCRILRRKDGWDSLVLVI